MNCEELLVEQAALTKAANPDTRVFVYRNLVKALPCECRPVGRGTSDVLGRLPR